MYASEGKEGQSVRRRRCKEEEEEKEEDIIMTGLRARENEMSEHVREGMRWRGSGECDERVVRMCNGRVSRGIAR